MAQGIEIENIPVSNTSAIWPRQLKAEQANVMQGE